VLSSVSKYEYVEIYIAQSVKCRGCLYATVGRTTLPLEEGAEFTTGPDVC
jgi:hypothetical protein